MQEKLEPTIDEIELAAAALQASYLHTARQRRIGVRRTVGPLPCVHYEYEREDARYVADIFFAWDTPPTAVTAQIQDYVPADRHQLLLLATEAEAQAHYKALGWRLLSRGYLMARSLPFTADRPTPMSPWQVREATRPGDIFYLNMMRESGGIMLDDLTDPTMRFYYVQAEEKPVGQARSARLSYRVSWVGNVYTLPEFRRRGIARALMQQIIADSGAEGAQRSVLLATPAAHSLYRQLGYVDLAPVLTLTMAGEEEPSVEDGEL